MNTPLALLEEPEVEAAGPLDELGAEILNYILDFPDLVIDYLPQIKLQFFKMGAEWFIIGGINSYLEKFQVVPDRKSLWAFLSPHMHTDNLDDPHAIKEIIFRGSNPRITPLIKRELVAWMKRQAHNLIFTDGTISSGCSKGQFDSLYQAVDYAKTVGESADDEMIDVQDLLETDYKNDWIVENVLLANQPCVIGGASKTLKTSIGLDLAVSIASGTKFLNRYKGHKNKVLFLSGESGKAAVKNTIQSIVKDRGLTNELRGWLFLEFQLPMLSNQASISTIRRKLVKNQIRVLFIDPLYLCLTTSSNLQATNIFDMGKALIGITLACQEASCTLILIHHFNRVGNPYTMPTLRDLSMAGCAEFCRQHMLLGRQHAYNADGIHNLNMALGREGGAEQLSITIDEGIPTARKWKVEAEEFSPTISKDNKKNKALIEKATRVVDVVKEMIERKVQTSMRQIRTELNISGSAVAELLEFTTSNNLLQKITSPTGQTLFLPIGMDVSQ